MGLALILDGWHEQCDCWWFLKRQEQINRLVNEVGVDIDN